MKQCRKCKLIKDNKDFSPNKRNSDGLQSYCKKCQSKIISLYLKTKGLEKKRLYQRSEKYHKWRNSYEKLKRKDPNFIKKRKGRNIGRFLRKSFCEFCGGKENLQAHHPDYNKPKEVITLCKECHLRLHNVH
jgi:hypothetical protein